MPRVRRTRRARKMAPRCKLTPPLNPGRKGRRGSVVPWMMFVDAVDGLAQADRRRSVPRSECRTSTLCTWFESCTTSGLNTGVRVSCSTSAAASGRRIVGTTNAGTPWESPASGDRHAVEPAPGALEELGMVVWPSPNGIPIGVILRPRHTAPRGPRASAADRCPSSRRNAPADMHPTGSPPAGGDS